MEPVAGPVAVPETEGRMSQEPTSGARVVPTELNAWVSVRRLDASRFGPRSATYGLPATCSSVNPDARTKRAARKSAYDCSAAAG